MNYRKTLIKIVTFLGGIYFFLEFILPAKIGNFSFGAYHDQISLGFVAISAMAIGLGLINLLAVHGKRLLFKKKGWIYSAALLGGLSAMLIIMSYDWWATANTSSNIEELYTLRDFSHVIVKERGRKDVPAQVVRTEALIKATKDALQKVENSLTELENVKGQSRQVYEKLVPNIASAKESIAKINKNLKRYNKSSVGDKWYQRLGENLGNLAGSWGDALNIAYEISDIKHLYTLLYEGLFFPLGAAMFSLLGFYIAAAAYRAFRVRSTESALMMLAAVIVMLGQIPFGIWIWSDLPEVRSWLLQIPSTAAFRAITIGASVGWLVMAFRMWFSIESESFSDKKKS